MRSSGLSRDALRSYAQGLFPAPLYDVIDEAIYTTAKLAPNVGTISRWRLLIDGALMLRPRRRVAQAHASGWRFTRYLMADGSMLHNQEFEHVVVRSLRSI